MGSRFHRLGEPNPAEPRLEAFTAVGPVDPPQSTGHDRHDRADDADDGEERGDCSHDDSQYGDHEEEQRGSAQFYGLDWFLSHNHQPYR